MKLTTERKPLSTRVQKLLRWTQRILFAAGILALAYVALTILDAHLYQVEAKRSLERQIEQEQEQEQERQPHTTTAAKPAVNAGDVLGRLDVPAVGLSVAILQGTGSRTLRLGAGHIEGTALPGEPGNVGIAGHRDTFFRELKDIHSNDEIQLQTATGLFHYRVDWAKVVDANDTTVLQPSPLESSLTLVTCYPFYYVGPAPQRFVVRAYKLRAKESRERIMNNEY